MNTLYFPENRNGKLYFDGVSVEKLAQEFDTPLYVISETRIRDNYRNLQNALTRIYKKVRIYYSAKANTNLSVLRILESEGANIDTVSPGEVFLALQAGFTPDKILFTGTNIRNDELKFLLATNVIMNIDSLSQLNRLLKMSLPDLLSVRINPEVGAGHHKHVITAGRDSKFGLWEDDAVKAYKTAKKAGIKRFGIHMHVGSGILNVEPLLLAIKKLVAIAKKVHDQAGVDFDFIDIGGGLGVPYKPEEKMLDVESLSEDILTVFLEEVKRHKLGEPIFCMEPGRFIVCDAGLLLTTVNTIKVTPFRKFVGIDTGFNTLIRPAMYGSYHHILVNNKLNLQDEELYDVVGPICESGDILAKDRKLPRIREGDLLAILNAGAYGFSMSSQYNSRPRAAEVLVKNGNYTLVRKRETLESLTVGQVDIRQSS